MSILTACASFRGSEKMKESDIFFPEPIGKWWYNSYLTSNCLPYHGFKAYAELTGKITEINNIKYFELLFTSSSDYNASRNNILKGKHSSSVGIREEDGKYYLHSDKLATEGFDEQLLFDINADVSSTWSAKWGTSLLRYDFTLAEKKFNSYIADTIYTFSVKQYPIASHAPELMAIILSPKRGIIGHHYTDAQGNFYSIRDDIDIKALLKNCDQD